MTPRTTMLAKALAHMDDRERAITQSVHEYHEAQFLAAKATFSQPEGIAAGVHDAVDSAIASTRKTQPDNARRVACRSGCAHCCHVDVAITEPEARLLIHAAAEIGHAIDTAHLRAQRDAADFNALDLAARRCVFLRADKTCAVYEHRPTSCRKYFAVDRAALCDTHKHPGARVLNFVSVEAEVLQSAAFATWPTGSMPRMLLEWL